MLDISRLPNTPSVRISAEFIAQAAEKAAEGNMADYASCLRLAAEFATNEVYPGSEVEFVPASAVEARKRRRARYDDCV